MNINRLLLVAGLTALAITLYIGFLGMCHL